MENKLNKQTYQQTKTKCLKLLVSAWFPISTRTIPFLKPASTAYEVKLIRCFQEVTNSRSHTYFSHLYTFLFHNQSAYCVAGHPVLQPHIFGYQSSIQALSLIIYKKRRKKNQAKSFSSPHKALHWLIYIYTHTHLNI